MSREPVRNLRHTRRSLVLVRNILQQANVLDGLAKHLEIVSETIDEILGVLSSGEI